MNKSEISDWDVPRPTLRLGLTLALGALGAMLFPGRPEWLPNPFSSSLKAASAIWLAAALACVILLRLIEREKNQWRRPRLIDLARVPAIALTAPLLLFAARPAAGQGRGSSMLMLSRAVFAIFPYAVATGFTLTLFGFEFARYIPRRGLSWFSFSVWSWMGCAVLFLSSPWPIYPCKSNRNTSRTARMTGGLGNFILIAMPLLAVLLWGRRHLLYDFLNPIMNPLLLLPCIGGGLLFILTPWPAFPRFPKLGDLPGERKIAPLGTILLLTIALLPLTTFAIRPVLYVISGKLFASSFDLSLIGALDQPTLNKGLFLFTYFSLLVGPYVAIARWLSDRRTSLGYWAFTDITIVLGIFLFCFLTIPFYQLILYVEAMGFTPRRVEGLMFCVAGYVALLGFLAWAIWPPQEIE